MLYEFRTLKDRRHASLIMLAGCDDDIEAILTAQQFIRKGEGLEVWRGDDLLYRLAPRIKPAKAKWFAGRRRPEGKPKAARGWLNAARSLVAELGTLSRRAPDAGIKH